MSESKPTPTQTPEKSNDYLFGFLLIMMVLALILFGFIAVLMGIDLAKAAIITTFLTNGCTLLLGYRWGSSKGSKEKMQTIAQELSDDNKTN